MFAGETNIPTIFASMAFNVIVSLQSEAMVLSGTRSIKQNSKMG